jgi:hypothetical protein
LFTDDEMAALWARDVQRERQREQERQFMRELPVEVPIAPPRVPCRGLSIPKIPPYLLPWEADFIAEKRAGGTPDSHIARMLGCSVERLNFRVKAPDPADVADAERRHQEHLAWIRRGNDQVQRRAQRTLDVEEERRQRELRLAGRGPRKSPRKLKVVNVVRE